MSEKRLLTIQDISCVGQCSLTVALPVISSFGTECAILPTAILSTHTAGFKGYTCSDFSDEIPNIVEHWKNENLKFDLIYTGYLCGKKQIELVKNAVNDLLINGGRFVVDPVMADHGKFYPAFDKEFARSMIELCSIADVIIPNITEACFLTDTEYIETGYLKDYVEELISKLLALGAKNVILTGVSFEEDKLGVAVRSSLTEQTEYYFRERILHNFHGTGDVYSSSLVGALSIGYDLFSAASLAVDFTVEAMKLSYEERLEHWYGVRFEKAIPYLCERIKQK